MPSTKTRVSKCNSATKKNKSRHLRSKLNHIKNPIGTFIRNLAMKHTSVMSKRTKKIWEYDANKELEKFL